MGRCRPEWTGAAPCEATATHCDKESVAGEYYYSVNLVVKANKLTPGVTYTFACGPEEPGAPSPSAGLTTKDVD